MRRDSFVVSWSRSSGRSAASPASSSPCPPPCAPSPSMPPISICNITPSAATSSARARNASSAGATTSRNSATTTTSWSSSRGPTAAAMIAALEQVAGRVREKPALFDRLFYKADLRALHDRALLMLPPDEIQTIQHNLGDMKELLTTTSVGPDSIFYPWRRLTLSSLLIRAGDSLPDGRRAQSRRRAVLHAAAGGHAGRRRLPRRPQTVQQPLGQPDGVAAGGPARPARRAAVFLQRRRRPGLSAGPADQGTRVVHRRPEKRRGHARHRGRGANRLSRPWNSA